MCYPCIMSTNVETLRAQYRARLEQLLREHGWAYFRPHWRKFDYRIDMDDVGIWFYEIPHRLAGLAWDAMPLYLTDDAINFPNGERLEL